MTQSSSLSVEDITLRCGSMADVNRIHSVVGSEPTSGDCHWPSLDIIMVDKLQLTMPTSVVWL